MFRIIIAALLCSGALALNVELNGLRGQAITPTDDLKKDLKDLKKQVEKKEEKEAREAKEAKERRAKLQKEIDNMVEAEKTEDKADAKRLQAHKTELERLRKQLKDLGGDVKAITKTEKAKAPEAKKTSADKAETKAEKKPEAKAEKKPEAKVKAEKKPEAKAEKLPELPTVKPTEVKAPIEVKAPKLKAPEVPKDVKDVAPKVEVPEVFPVPTTSRCIVIMCCQYMIVYLALAVCRTYYEFSGKPKGTVEGALRAAAQTLTYGPMLCVLFIACRMRVEFLSDGKGQPQAWVQNCMYALTFAVLASTIMVLVMPFVTGKPLALKEGSCDLERPQLEAGGNKNVFYVLSAVRYLILLGLYGGLAGVIVGICTYMPPGATSLNTLPAPAPAVMCTMILATAFFMTQLVIAACRTYTEFKGLEFPKIVGVMNAAANTMEFAPMLAILFLSARMRALQHDGQPQSWAQDCMYAATFALCMTTVLAIVVPLVMGGTMKTNPATKETTFDVPNPMIGYGLVGVRFLCMFAFYGGCVGVAYSIFCFEAPKGPTLPVSPTVHCVVNLTVQFFFVYLMQTIMLTVSEVSGGKIALDRYKIFAAIESTKSTLAFAPMLSILFVTTRMYALLITDKKGAPQAWVQDGMYMATWSLLISFVACMATGLVMDKVETDEDGNVVNKFSNKYVALSMVAIRYIAMFLLYGGISMVIVGLFTMTPETANGRGAVPIVSDAVKSPPGPQDVSGAGKKAGDLLDSK